MKPNPAIRRPALRYHGGKYLQAPHIISHFPEHRTYVEPFGGGASVLLRKPISFSEVYNDLDDEVVGFFRVLRDHGRRLVELLELTPFSRAEFNGAYQPTGDPIERARRTAIRSFMGFGSDGIHSSHRTGFRGRSQRSGTTPAGDWANYPMNLRRLIERFQGVVIEQREALRVIVGYDSPTTLFYVDPPYVHSTRQRVDRARGYRHELSDANHRSLLEVLNSVQGMVVLSGYPSPLYEEMLGGWRRIERTGPFSDGARKRTEVLWLRNVSVSAEAAA